MVRLTVRVLVNTTNLVLFWNSKLEQHLHGSHDDGSAHSRESHTSQRTNNLLAQQQEATTVDEAVVNCEDARQDGTGEATRAVQAEGVKSVIHQVDPVHQLTSEVTPRRAQHAKGNAPARCDKAGCGCDDHQTWLTWAQILQLPCNMLCKITGLRMCRLMRACLTFIQNERLLRVKIPDANDSLRRSEPATLRVSFTVIYY